MKNYGYNIGDRVRSKSGTSYTDDATGIVKTMNEYGVEVTLETAKNPKDVGRTILFTSEELFPLQGNKFERITEEFPEIYLALHAFVEYFEQIEKGGYSSTRPAIRPFEQILLNKGREALAPLKEESNEQN